MVVKHNSGSQMRPSKPIKAPDIMRPLVPVPGTIASTVEIPGPQLPPRQNDLRQTLGYIRRPARPAALSDPDQAAATVANLPPRRAMMPRLPKIGRAHV